MQRLPYLLAYPFLWLISRLPYRLFYTFSDMVFVLVFYVVRYRKKVVRRNLELAFPEKSSAEINQIRRKFYHHFCDIFLETAKSLTISAEEIKARFVLKNPEELKRIEALNKSCITMLAHYNSYEWITALRMQGMTYEAYGIYKKLANPYFDKLIRSSRERFNCHALDKNLVSRMMLGNKKEGVLSNYAMIADQSPRLAGVKYWRPFFGHRVPVFIGSERLSKKLDFSVAFLKIEKVKRGYYTAEFVSLADNPKTVEDYGITDRYFGMLEEQIRQNPENYLWTHKRWKHEHKEHRETE